MNVLIKNGRIVDGTGNPWYYGDIEVVDGKINRMARKLRTDADRTIDAEGLVATPGFVDTHCHVDGYCLICPDMAPYVFQGITTQTLGLCGHSVFPDKQTFLEVTSTSLGATFYRNQVIESGYDWHSLTEYRQLVRSIGITIDVIPFIGHGNIQWKAGVRTLKARDVRKPTPQELEEMKRLTRQGMEEGAFGLSEGMDQPPNRYAEEDEIIELAKIAAEYNGILDLQHKLCEKRRAGEIDNNCC